MKIYFEKDDHIDYVWDKINDLIKPYLKGWEQVETPFSIQVNFHFKPVKKQTIGGQPREGERTRKAIKWGL